MLFIALLVAIAVVSLSVSEGFSFTQNGRINNIRMAAQDPWFPASVTSNTVAFDSLK